MPDVKITLDHTAVREFMKSDPDFTIELKKAVIQSAMKGHIKKVTEQEFDRTFKKYANEEIEKQVGHWYKESWNKPASLTLNASVAASLKKTIAFKTEQAFRTIVKDEINKAHKKLVNETEPLIESFFINEGKNRILRTIKKRLDDLVEMFTKKFPIDL